MRYLPTVWPRKNIPGVYRQSSSVTRPCIPAYNLRVLPRFYVPLVDATGSGVLPDEEATHLTRVLRLGVGAAVEVFDGRGGVWVATVTEISRRHVAVMTTAGIPAPVEPRVRVQLVVSALKGDKLDDVVRDAAMVGVSDIHVVVTQRSEVSMAAVLRGGRVDRWRRIAVSSLKQCGRAILPTVHAPQSLAQWASAGARGTLLVMCEPAAGEGRRISDVPRTGEVTLVVGPEGGWTPDELALLSGMGAIAVQCGGLTLRADAAPLVGVAALCEGWQAW
jgi:16S rRNA (uracil1498-N3)-methyltransferase